MCDLTTCLLTEVEVDQVLSQVGLDIGLSAGNSAVTPLVHSSELFKQETLGRKSGSASFVNKAGCMVIHNNCLEFRFFIHLMCQS